MNATCSAELKWEVHTLVCDRLGQHLAGSHHMHLLGRHVWWADGIVEAVTDAQGVTVSLLPKPAPKPVPLDSQGYKTRNTKQRRTDAPTVAVGISNGKGRNWRKTT